MTLTFFPRSLSSSLLTLSLPLCVKPTELCRSQESTPFLCLSHSLTFSAAFPEPREGDNDIPFMDELSTNILSTLTNQESLKIPMTVGKKNLLGPKPRAELICERKHYEEQFYRHIRSTQQKSSSFPFGAQPISSLKKSWIYYIIIYECFAYMHLHTT